MGCVTCRWRWRLRRATRDHENGARIRRGWALPPWDAERAHRLTRPTGRRLSRAEPRADITDGDVPWSGLVEGEEDARERER
jgi:hypothetical protein